MTRRDVLIVDDDESIRRLIGTSLRRMELSCDMAADGVEAVTHLSATVYGVMLLDLMMPRLDGFGVLEQCSRMSFTDTHRPVILVLTASMSTAPLQEHGDLVQAVIRKPFDVRELTQLVRDCVVARRQNARARSTWPVEPDRPDQRTRN